MAPFFVDRERPDSAMSLSQRLAQGIQLHQARNWPAAEQLYLAILAQVPDNADALCMLGVLRHQQGDTQSAIALTRQALAVRPNSAELQMNLGNLLKAQFAWEEAITCYRAALRLKPGLADACINLGNALLELGRPAEALGYYERARAVNPSDSQVHGNIGAALRAQGRITEAIGSYHVAVALRPDNAVALANLGNALWDTGDWQGSVQAYQNALKVQPDRTETLAALLRRYQAGCYWPGVTDIEQRLLTPRHLHSGRFNLFNFLSLQASPAQQLAAATGYAQRVSNNFSRTASTPQRHGDRLRVGYLSADFRDHPVTHLTAQLFELHDRKKVEVFGYATYGRTDQGALRQRVSRAFDHFVDIEDVPPQTAAERIAADDLHILVDLTGYTRHSPIAILARRPAPIQVSYLGYPGTTGGQFIDYIITDRFVTPPDSQRYYTEQFVYMPYCFQINDRTRQVARDAVTRRDCGLDDASFVFCCFNQSYKITARIFDVWMRLLRTLPGSVLWLSDLREPARYHLQQEAQHRGIETSRLVFAERLPDMAQHLARYQLADLFLDTLPFNAHTTASDALWAGLPVVTCAGETYASRVAGSLLTTMGLPELVTFSLADYEALALQLARTPAQLQHFRQRLEQNRLSGPLFSSAPFTRDLERAFAIMSQRHRQGVAPAPIDVPRS